MKMNKFFIGASFLAAFLVAIFLSYLGFFSSLVSNSAQAGAGENVSGWAWSETIGWLSFNNTTGGGSVSYGAHIDSATGNMSGYAWAEHIGWIKFNPAGPFPSAPNYSAKLNPTNGEASGWMRACAGAANADCSGGTSLDSGGWDGWIKLRKDAADTGADYGVSLTVSTGDFHGWAWGGDVVGWVSFNCAEPGSCASSSYKVSTLPNIFNAPPLATNLSTNSGTANYCGSVFPPIVLSWQFTDPGDSQSAYQVQADNNSDFSSPEKDSGKVLSSSLQYAPSQISYGTTYYWRAKVWDSQDVAGAFAVGPSFGTALHQYPTPDFTWSPLNPGINENTNFTDTSQVYGGALKSSWSWTFQNGSPSSSTSQNPQNVKFSSLGSKQVSQRITDSDGFSCQINKTVSISLPFPGWQEISPF